MPVVDRVSSSGSQVEKPAQLRPDNLHVGLFGQVMPQVHIMQFVDDSSGSPTFSKLEQTCNRMYEYEDVAKERLFSNALERVARYSKNASLQYTWSLLFCALTSSEPSAYELNRACQLHLYVRF